MKKTWWWRILFTMLTASSFIWSYLVVNAYKLGICHKGGYCLFNYSSYIDPLAFFSIFLFITSIFLFFINDTIFLKWLWFAAGWIVFSVLVLILVPEQKEGLFSFGGPDKEQISIWLGSLFVILSLGKIGWEWRKEKGLQA